MLTATDIQALVKAQANATAKPAVTKAAQVSVKTSAPGLP